jgi:hypothetical protein
MMYLSTALQSGPHLRTVLTHEYTHAVTLSAKATAARNARQPVIEEEGWLDEGLAHLVEDLHGFSRTNVDYRVSAFLSDPCSYRLVVDDYYAADLFRSHGNRGAAYLFLRWCADQFGPDLISRLIRTDRVGLANLETATGRSFEDLYRTWSIALYVGGFDPAHRDDAGFASLDTCTFLADGEIAGPRTSVVMPDGPLECWNSAATASRFFVVGSSSRGAVEVQVSAPLDAMLQVTAIPLPNGPR